VQEKEKKSKGNTVEKVIRKLLKNSEVIFQEVKSKQRRIE
jgi:hypothetical protein